MGESSTQEAAYSKAILMARNYYSGYDAAIKAVERLEKFVPLAVR